MRAAVAGTLAIHTAEGVSFSLPLAGPMTRFLAWAIDFAAVLALLSIANVGVGFLRLVSSDAATAVSIAANFVAYLAYGIVLEWYWRGQTIGKRVLGLRVRDERGLRLRFEQIVLRNLLRAVDLLPALYLIGGIACLVSKYNQRLGDLAAGTVVVREPKTSAPRIDDVMGHKYNSFRDHPHLEARLRRMTPPDGAALALETLARRDSLDPTHRLKVFADLAAYFRTISEFPEEASIGTTDEQYVRNVIDSLYHARRRDRSVQGRS